MFLLWSNCTKQKTDALHRSLVPRVPRLPGEIQAGIWSEHLVSLSIRRDIPCKGVNEKEYMSVYWQLQHKAAGFDWTHLCPSPLPARSASSGGGLCTAVAGLTPPALLQKGCGINTVLSHDPPCSRHKQQNAHALEEGFKTLKELHIHKCIQAKMFFHFAWEHSSDTAP